MKLSILDVRGMLPDTLRLAPLADSLGYHRYWIAEHQPQPTPILTAAIIAGLTERLRIGTAGILLHYYPPLRTAHDFHFLEAVYTGRIDAGFCGGIDPDFPSEELEGRDLGALIRAYPERVARLVRHLRNTSADPSYDAKTSWGLAPEAPPEIWSLGGPSSAELAATHGLCFGYSLLYGTSLDDPACIRRYRERFAPVRNQPEPATVIAVCISCAETGDQAQEATWSTDSFFVPRIVGDPQSCAQALRALAERYEVDEVVVADRCREFPARVRCYELLAHELL